MLWKERSREKMGSGKTSWRRKTHKLRLEGGGGKCRQRRKSWPSFEAVGWYSGVWLCQVIYLTTFVVVRSLSCVWLLVTAWTAAYQATLSFTISQSLLKFMSLVSAMLYNHLILCCLLFLLPSIFPSIRVFFPVSQLFVSRGQSIRASTSASALPVDIQGWFPWGLTGLISLQSKRLSRVFSSTIFWKHQFFSAQPSLWSSSHICTCLLEKP